MLNFTIQAILIPLQVHPQFSNQLIKVFQFCMQDALARPIAWHIGLVELDYVYPAQAHPQVVQLLWLNH